MASGARVIFTKPVQVVILTWFSCRETAALLTALGSRRKNSLWVMLISRIRQLSSGGAVFTTISFRLIDAPDGGLPEGDRFKSVPFYHVLSSSPTRYRRPYCQGVSVIEYGLVAVLRFDIYTVQQHQVSHFPRHLVPVDDFISGIVFGYLYDEFIILGIRGKVVR